MNYLKICTASLLYIYALACSTTASAVPIFSFLADGDTAFEPYVIMNWSPTGEYVTAFHLDITSTGTCFDVIDAPRDACPGNAANGLVEFAAVGDSDTTTGLVAPIVKDGDTVLDFYFNDFGPGEILRWYLDVDAINSGRNGSILGHQLIGATAYVDFSNGERIHGTLDPVAGNPDASAFIARGIPRLTTTAAEVPLPSTLSLFLLASLGLFRRKTR